MSRETVYHIICDREGCSETFSGPTWLPGDASRVGWYLSLSGGKDLCPKCRHCEYPMENGNVCALFKGHDGEHDWVPF